MTSPLRRKRPTTVRVRSTPPRTAYSLAALGLLLCAAAAPAQSWSANKGVYAAPTNQPAQVLPPRPTPVQPVYFQKPAAGERPVEQLTEYTVSLEPPGRETLFRLESQAAFFERLRQEALNRVPPERIEFPPEPVLSKDVYLGRSWP